MPVSVVDFGCGTGAWLAAFAERGAVDLVGVEAGRVDNDRMDVPSGTIKRLSLEKPIDLGRRFDLAVSLETAEHLPASAAQTLVSTLGRHSDTVLFSAAIPGQGGTYHLNEQWPMYWFELFTDGGYECFDCLRESLWRDDEVSYWYRQNLLVYAFGASARRLRAEGYIPGPPMPLVHPELFAQKVKELESFESHVPGVRYEIGRLRKAVAATLRRRMNG